MFGMEDKIQGSTWSSQRVAISPSRLSKKNYSQRHQSLKHITQPK
jgi:hypothetical protein